MKALLTVPEAAALLAVSPRSIYYLIRGGALQPEEGGDDLDDGVKQKNAVPTKKLCKLIESNEPCLQILNKSCNIERMDTVVRRLLSDQDRLLMLRDVAVILNVSYSTALDLFRRKKLRGIRLKFGNNMIRVFESSVIQLLEENSNQATCMEIE